MQDHNLDHAGVAVAAAAERRLLEDRDRVVAVLEAYPQRSTPPRMSALAVAQAAGFPLEPPGSTRLDGRVRALRALRRAESDGLVVSRSTAGAVLWSRA